jgi:hypothetical protein
MTRPDPSQSQRIIGQRQLPRRFMAHRPFRQMLARQGVDLAGTWWRGLEGMIFRALRACSRCSRAPECRTWLAQGHANEACPSFCPNSRIIEACRILDPRAPAPHPPGAGRVDRGDPPITALLADPLVERMREADGVSASALQELLTSHATRKAGEGS